jgi:hypothetical protein
MLKLKIQKFRALLVSTISIVGLLAYVVSPAYADTLSASVQSGPSCTAEINGSNATSINVVSGNVTALTMTNTDGAVPENVSGPGVAGGTQLGTQSKSGTGPSSEQVIFQQAISSPVTITFTPLPSADPDPGIDVDYCPLGSTPVSGTLTLVPVVITPAATGGTTKLSSSTSTPTTTKPATNTPAPTNQAVSTPTSTAITATPKNDILTTTGPKNNLKSKKTSALQEATYSGLAVVLILLICASYFGYIPYKKIWQRLKHLF